MKRFLMAVVAILMTFSAYAQFYIYLSDGTVLKADSVSMVAPIPGTLLKAAFSVSATEKVHFSQGNLQYQASTKTWRFAENQYDVIGNSNSNISATYSGWIDLFGWGTGNNPTNTSTNYSDYSTFTDWGVNAISNGGNEANTWRTLTNDEWNYLFNTRTNASSKYGVAEVNGVNGMILLPDDWTLPAGLTFTSGVAGNYGSENYKMVNEYTAAQWLQMESAGAVFLPAAGDRYGTDVNSVGDYGYYWSSTPYGTNYAYYRRFSSSSTDWGSNGRRYYGQSVRLVR